MNQKKRALKSTLLAAALLLGFCHPGLAQEQNPPVVITLDDAIHRAQANDPGYAGAKADRASASLDRSIARAALLPSVVYHNQYLYTQPNGERVIIAGSQPAPRFIANNTVHEYMSQGQVNETLGIAPAGPVCARRGRIGTRCRSVGNRTPRPGSQRGGCLLHVAGSRPEVARDPARGR